MSERKSTSLEPVDNCNLDLYGSAKWRKPNGGKRPGKPPFVLIALIFVAAAVIAVCIFISRINSSSDTPYEFKAFVRLGPVEGTQSVCDGAVSPETASETDTPAGNACTDETADPLYESFLATGYVFEDSARVLISDERVEMLRASEMFDLLLSFAVDELYARAGYRFETEPYRSHYEAMHFEQIYTMDETAERFSEIENRNLARLVKLRDEK